MLGGWFAVIITNKISSVIERYTRLGATHPLDFNQSFLLCIHHNTLYYVCQVFNL
jgi:hypothetical protein